MKQTQGIIFAIKRFAIHDGPGIRTTIFFKGCPMHCHWCHNPEGRKKNPQKTSQNNTIGEEKTAAEVMQEIEKETLFHDESGGGVTISGGEPLKQPAFLGALLDECKKREIHTALDTTGCVSPRVFDAIIDKVDLFLYDLKIMDNKKHLHYTGVSNRRVLENLKTLSQRDKKVIIRFPVIPGITDAEENIKAAAVFVSSLKNIRQIDLLPYHRTAEAKYKRLRMIDKMAGVKPPTTEHMKKISNLFKKYTKNKNIEISDP
jgi:pyruvate formate lyase activating enzyme